MVGKGVLDTFLFYFMLLNFFVCVCSPKCLRSRTPPHNTQTQKGDSSGTVRSKITLPGVSHERSRRRRRRRGPLNDLYIDEPEVRSG